MRKLVATALVASLALDVASRKAAGSAARWVANDSRYFPQFGKPIAK